MKNKTKISSSIIVVIYVILIGLLITSVYRLSQTYGQKEMEMIIEIERDISEALGSNQTDELINKIDESRDRYDYDIVVLRDDKLVYNSVAYNEGDVLIDRVHPNVVVYESQGTYPADSSYWVWYSIYRMSDTLFLNSFLWGLVVTSLISTALMAFTVILITKYLLKPLKNIDKSLDLVDQYQFEDIDDEDDLVNKKFKDFAVSLEKNISAVSRQHTDLERQLQTKRDLLNNTIIVSRSMVHDLKTPVHRNILENEIIARETKNEEVRDISQKNQRLNQDLMEEINTILLMLKDEESLTQVDKTSLDVVRLLITSFKRFSVNIKEKSLYVDIDAPDFAFITVDQATLTLLINNLLSNMVQYSKIESDLKVSVEALDEYVELIFENESNQNDIERMRKTEKIFNVIKNPTDDSHIYSSGNGLYLIQNLVSMLNGNYEICTDDHTVIIKVRLPYE